MFLLQTIFFLNNLNVSIPFAYGAVVAQFSSIYTAAFHLAIATLLVLERDRLEEFNIDRFTLYIFIFGSFLRIRSDVFDETISLILIALSGGVLIVLLFLRKLKTSEASIQLACIGISIGLLLSIITIFVEILVLRKPPEILLINNSFTITAIKTMLYVFPSVAAEEILFRGFIWGYLKKLDWKENKIAWFQGALFWMAHFSRIFTPYSFFITLPLLTITSTKLAMKSKQTYPSILSHAVLNILGKLFYTATI